MDESQIITSEWTTPKEPPGNYTLLTLREWEAREGRAQEFLGESTMRRRLPRWDYVALLVAWAAWTALVWAWAVG
uniref:Uncharacterized protein n=1 Tax=viral metagenome TaxID=1070528 RepID=A0A6M3XIG4_9ZZZZ